MATVGTAEQLQRDGFVLLKGLLSISEIQDWLNYIATQLKLVEVNGTDGFRNAIQSRDGRVSGIRNILDFLPYLREAWRRPSLEQWLIRELGDEAGLVRGLYFDKPPGASWSLPWHKDRTLAVRSHPGPSDFFQHPTTKAGVRHVEADQRLLNDMLTLRFHLDPADQENGALWVQPGSHLDEVHNGREVQRTSDARDAVLVEAEAGDVLVMRPLLNHSSGNSDSTTHRHRRIVHLEFARRRHLPDEYQWQWYVPLVTVAEPGE